jgi:hypothetical protein
MALMLLRQLVQFCYRLVLHFTCLLVARFLKGASLPITPCSIVGELVSYAVLDISGLPILGHGMQKALLAWRAACMLTSTLMEYKQHLQS